MANELNIEQKKAVEHGNGPLLIIAGAGTGKTTVITERIKHIIKSEHARPEEILALTFTEKAAKEMEDRVDKMMPYGYTQMWISTFHGFCDTLLRQEGIAIGLNPNFKLMTESESIMFMKKNIFKLSLEYFRPMGNPNKFLEALLNHFSRLQDEDITPSEYLKFAKSQKSLDGNSTEEEQLEQKRILELATVYQQYSEMKLAEGVLDFSDLIAQALNLLRVRKNILKIYREKFKYILVDEFQDTNFAQNELAILLAGTKQNITVVADDDQAIYRWRGAALSNVIQFRNNFSETKIITLIKNYRSTQEILDRSYEMIQHNNPNRLEIVENINKKLISERKIKGDLPELLFANRVDEEAETVAKKIKTLIKKNKLKFSDFAILVRANNHAQPFTVALTREKIPYQFLGPGYLFRQEEIKNLIAYFKVLYNLEDSVSLYRVLSMDIFDFSARDISSLLTFAKKRNISLFESLEHANEIYFSDETKVKIEKFVKMVIKHLERIKKDPPGQILYYFLLDSGLLTSFLDIKSEKDEKEANNIAKFFDRIKTYETINQDASIYGIVDWIDLQMEMGDSPLVSDIDYKEANAVNILTIHSSKGLEFPVVFMVNLVNDRFPTRARQEKIPLNEKLIKEITPEGDHHIQEERRLFYVGMTRAKDQLFFTGAKFYADGKREKKISPFVFEALPDLVQKIETEKSVKQLTFLESIKDYQEEKIEEESKKYEYKISYITFSNLQMFDICPLHYKAKAIFNIPTPSTYNQSFGISLHNTLEIFYKNVIGGNKQDLDDFKSILKAEWISEGYSNKTHEMQMFESANKMLEDYYKSEANPIKKPLGLEMPFSFNLKNGVKVFGKIDRIDPSDSGHRPGHRLGESHDSERGPSGPEGIEIIDYKTGQDNPKAHKSHELQLAMYALAANRIKDPVFNHDPENVKLTLHFLGDNSKKSMSFKKADLDKLEDDLISKIEEIEKSDFKCSKNVLCVNCEYKILCSAN